MRRIIGPVFAALLTVTMTAMASDKTDIVIFNNGDRLTGEVRSLDRGLLRFNTDATGIISIEWNDVASVKSNQNIQVETEEGVRFLGPLALAAEERLLVVETDDGNVSLDSEHVVHMEPIEGSRLDRLDLDVTAGYNFAKASEVQQFTIGLNANYRTEVRRFGLSYDGTLSDSQDNEASQRQNLAFDYTRFLRDRWLAGAFLNLDSNDELGLNLRTSIGASGGRILRQSNSSALQLTGGLQVSRENLASGVPTEDTLEAVGTLNWDWFRFDTPELDLSTSLQVIPNLSDTGRVRAELDIKFKWEIVSDLFWQLSLYSSFDSDPVNVDAENNDYGINTSLGWEF